jgi:hypothetical protein
LNGRRNNSPPVLFTSLLVLCASQLPIAMAYAAADAGGIVQGVLNFPEFRTGPHGGFFDLNADANGIPSPYPPYTPIVNSPFEAVDDAVNSPGIPGVVVYLKNTSTNATTITVTTDNSGAFVFPSQPAGTYALCWSAGLPGLAPGCSTETFDAIDHVSNRWAANRGASSIINWDPLDAPAPGNILALEGYVSAPGLPTPYAPNLNTACVHNDPFLNINEVATVQLRDSANAVLATVNANSLGRFLLAVNSPNVSTSYTLSATCGTSSTSMAITATSPARLFQTLTLPANTPPVISALKTSKSKNGPALAGAPLGAEVHVIATAMDSDGDPLTYHWRATAGEVKGKGLHFLYVDVDDGRGGHRSDRVALSTDAGFIAAAPPTPTVVQPADFYTDADRFLTYRGIDTRKSACEYYKAIGATQDCTAKGKLIDPINFRQWLNKFGLSRPPSPYSDTPSLNPGELHAQFRNVADLNLVRNHHARNAGPDANGKDQVGYYVCNHAKPTGAVPDTNLVACVSMEYSVTPGQNDGKPFTKFLTFGPTGALIPSVNLDGRGEKYTPGNCVPCHGGDNYFNHFPEHGAGAHDGNIGAYFIPFDLDNFTYQTQGPYTQSAQEDAVRGLNLGLKTGEMTTSAALEIVNGWYPGGAGVQQSGFIPKGWDPTKTPSVPVAGQPNSQGHPYTFNGKELYSQVVKPSCRGCHLTMGPELGLDFHSYDYDGTPGDFVGGHATIPRTHINDSHTNYVVCAKYNDGLPTYNFAEDINSPARTMPNAVQTFNRFWNDHGQVDLMQKYLSDRYDNGTLTNIACGAPGS